MHISMHLNFLLRLEYACLALVEELNNASKLELKGTQGQVMFWF